MRRGKSIYNKVAAGAMDGQSSPTRSLEEGGEERCWEVVLAGTGASAGTGWVLRTITILTGGVLLRMIWRKINVGRSSTVPGTS